MLHDAASIITLLCTVRTAAGYTAGHLSVGHPFVLHLLATNAARHTCGRNVPFVSTQQPAQSQNISHNSRRDSFCRHTQNLFLSSDRPRQLPKETHCRQLRLAPPHARSTFHVVQQVTSARFGLPAANRKFSTQHTFVCVWLNSTCSNCNRQ